MWNGLQRDQSKGPDYTGTKGYQSQNFGWQQGVLGNNKSFSPGDHQTPKNNKGGNKAKNKGDGGMNNTTDQNTQADKSDRFRWIDFL